MATDLGDRITEIHRAQQIQVVTPLINAARGYSRAVVPGNRATYGAYADLLMPTVARTRRQTETLAGRYYQQMSTIESPRRRSIVSLPTVTDSDYEPRIRSSVGYLGERYAKRLDSGVRPARAEEQLRTDLTGMVMRNALEPAREQIREAVRADAVATGFVRVTAMDTFVCWFCSMLATREDYKETSFDRSDPRFEIGGNPLANAKVHDHCRCMLRPMFDHELPTRNEWLKEQWYEMVDDEDRDSDLKKAWRTHWEQLVASGNVPWLGAPA